MRPPIDALINQQKKIDLVNLIVEQVYDIITGHESAFYKSILQGGELITFDKLRNSKEVIPLIAFGASNYCNKLYKSLIIEDDPRTVNHFNEMTSILDHSCVCLLHLLFTVIMYVHTETPRSDLVIDSYDEYMRSVTDQIKIQLERFRNSIHNSISHKCEGADIKTCDPNIPLFNL